MRPLDIVRLPKTVAVAGDWKVTTAVSKMPSTAFALTKRASFSLGRGWHWRVDLVATDGFSLRLLTAFHGDREEFLAWLAIQEDDGLRIVARYEFHGTHPGWHYHTAECDHEELPVGDPRPRAFGRAVNGGEDFGIREPGALAKSFNFFNVTGSPEGGLL
jgi:hypothetical protein